MLKLSKVKIQIGLLGRSKCGMVVQLSYVTFPQVRFHNIMNDESDDIQVDKTKALLRRRARQGLPAYFGIDIVDLGPGYLTASMDLAEHHLATNGYLHAGAIVTLADTSCGFGCFANLPDGARNFTTVELKSNFLRSTTNGTLFSRATLVHAGRRTQVWDATVFDDSDKTLALFRCTQMILY